MIAPEKFGQQRGTVINWHRNRGFGFIQLDAGGEVFVHFRDVEDSPGLTCLEPGTVVDAYVDSGRNGLVDATQVRIVAPPQEEA